MQTKTDITKMDNLVRCSYCKQSFYVYWNVKKDKYYCELECKEKAELLEGLKK